MAQEKLLYDRPWQSRDVVLRDFEEAWRAGANPSIKDLLQYDSSECNALLPELVFVDLEYRLKSAMPVCVEDYCDQFASLAADHDTLVELLMAEFDFRRRREPSLSISEYRERFPQIADQLERAVSAQGNEPTKFAGFSETTSILPEELRHIRDYELQEKIGEGGMGAVYRAMHVNLKRAVAIKVLPKDLTSDDEAISRFRREMEAVGRVVHPNIVLAHDAGEVDNQHFLVMEFVDGMDLSQLVARTGALKVADACELVRQAAVGLQHAHNHGLVHRDIKPSNMMLADTGLPQADGNSATVKILDLGLALLADPHTDDGELTSTGQLMGTIDYMAPEQCDDSHEVTAKADIYGLGATLYKLLCGTAPFGDPQYSSILKKMKALSADEPIPIRERNAEVPEQLAEIVHGMLAKDPKARMESPSDVATALKPFTVGSNLAALLQKALASQCSAQTNVTASAATEALRSYASETSRSDALVITEAKSSPRVSNEFTTESNQAISPRAKSSARSGRRSTFLALCGLAVAALVSLGIVISIQTDEGTVVIEYDGKFKDELAVSVLDGGREIKVLDKSNQWSIDIAEGEYRVAVKGSSDRFELEDDQLTVRRGNREVVTIALVEQVEAIRSRASSTPPQEVLAHRNYALEFDGEKSHVKVPSLIFDGTHPLTIEATVSGAQYVSRNGSTFVGWDGMARLAMRSSGHALFDTNGARAGSEPTPVFNHSYHVAAVWEGRDVHIYVNGQQQQLVKNGHLAGATAALPEVADAARRLPTNFCIGASFDPDRTDEPLRGLFRGEIDEIRISRVPRYTSDFTPSDRFEPDADTMALYHCDEGHGDKLIDSSGNGHDGVIHNTRWLIARHRPIPEIEPPANGEPGLIRKFFGHRDIVNAMAFLPDGKHLVSADNDGILRKWDLESGRQVARIEVGSACVRLAVLPDGKRVVTSHYDRQLRISDLTGKEKVKDWLRDIFAIAISSDGKRLCTLRHNEKEQSDIELWDTSTLVSITSLTVPVYHGGYLAVGNDQVASGTTGLDAYDLTGKRLVRFGHPYPDPKNSWDYYNSAAWSPDGKLLAGGPHTGFVDVIDMASGERPHRFQHGPGGIGWEVSVEFTPDGRHLISGCNDKSICVWSIADGKLVHRFRADTVCTQRIAVSPDGRYVVSGSGVNRHSGDWREWDFDGDCALYLWRLPKEVWSKSDATSGSQTRIR